MVFQKQHGFTLMELMVTVAILAVVASIAIPAYNGYITTAKMSEAHNALAELKLAEEEYYLENNTYFSGISTSALSAYWTPSEPSPNFDYKVVAGSTGSIATSYKITATGKSGTAVDGKTAVIP